jgi:hypothetical protein
MGVQAVEFSMGSGSENAVDAMLVGMNKVRTGSDANLEASEPRDLPFFRSIIHFTQYLHVDVRPVKERPDVRFRHYDLPSRLQFSSIPRCPTMQTCARVCRETTLHDSERLTSKPKSNRHRMIAASVLNDGWVVEIKRYARDRVFVAEGLFPYFTEEEHRKIFTCRAENFPGQEMLVHTMARR